MELNRRTCVRYSFTYASARLKMTLRLSFDLALAAAALDALAVAHASSRWRFFKRLSGTAGAMVTMLKGRSTGERLEMAASES